MLDPLRPTADQVIDEEREAERLAAILAVVYLLMLRQTHSLVTEALGLDPLQFRITRADIAAQLERARSRASLITATTKNGLDALLAEARSLGLETAEIVASVDALYGVTWEARPGLQALNEAHNAMLTNAQERYLASGVVEFQLLRDGDYDAACRARDGAIVPITTPVEQLHPNCLPGDQVVLAPNLVGSMTREFDGEVIVLRTAADDFLTCTPNHPILTEHGWLPAHAIREGSGVFRCLDAEGVQRRLAPNDQHRPAPIEQIADTLGRSIGSTAATMPGSTIDFHGEGAQGHVNVVRTDSLAYHRAAADLLKHFLERAIQRANVELFHLSGRRALDQLGFSANHPSDGIMSSLGVGGSFVLSHSLDATPQSLGARQDRTALLEVGIKPSSLNAQFPSQVVDGFSGLIAPVRVVNVDRRVFKGHVYNLETSQGWYIAQNIITHNCRIVTRPVRTR